MLVNSAEKSKEAISSYEGIETYSLGGDGHCVGDITPFTIGELAICFLQMAGPAADNACISVTHVAHGSTKLPVLFTGDFLGVWYAAL